MTCVPIPGGILCMAQTEIACPECGSVIDVGERMERSKRGHCVPMCHSCGLRIDVYEMIDGKLRVSPAEKQSVTRKRKKHD